MSQKEKSVMSGFEKVLQEFAENLKRFNDISLQIEEFNRSLLEIDKRLERIVGTQK
jgi:hypothetical protein